MPHGYVPKSKIVSAWLFATLLDSDALMETHASDGDDAATARFYDAEAVPDDVFNVPGAEADSSPRYAYWDAQPIGNPEWLGSGGKVARRRWRVTVRSVEKFEGPTVDLTNLVRDYDALWAALVGVPCTEVVVYEGTEDEASLGFVRESVYVRDFSSGYEMDGVKVRENGFIMEVETQP